MLRRAPCVANRDPQFAFKSPYKTPEGKLTNKWLLMQHGTSQRCAGFLSQI